MKIVVDKLPASCRKCLFYVPGEIVHRSSLFNRRYCRLTRLHIDEADKGRHKNCPLTANENKK